MEAPLLASFMQHLDNTCRQFVDKGAPYLLCLDGHASRKGKAWLEECMRRGIDVVVNAANTSHFLQPCDQRINKRFQKFMREIRDEFCRQGRVDTTRVNFSVSCAIYAWENISTPYITESFRVTGLYPFQRDFALQFKTDEERRADAANSERKRAADAGIASRVRSVRQRTSDRETLEEIEQIMKMKNGASYKIQQLTELLQRAETLTAILQGNTSCGATASTAPTNARVNRRVLYDAGAPGQFVTHATMLQQRKDREARQQQEEVERRQRRQEEQEARERRNEENRAAILCRKRARHEAREAREVAAKQRRLPGEARRSARDAERARKTQQKAEAREREKYVKAWVASLGTQAASRAEQMARTRDKAADGIEDRKRTKAQRVSTRSINFVARIVVEVVDRAMSESVES